MTRKTEQLYRADTPIDTLPPAQAAQQLVSAQIEAAQSVMAATKALARAADAMAQTLRVGGHLYYAAAGSSGLMAAADAMELGGTFGVPASQVHILMAGGLPRSAEMPGDVEDEDATLAGDLARLCAQDCLITLSASGTTPFALTAAKIAKSKGATLIALTNMPDALLLEHADHPIVLDTPPEALSGSTRLGAGTAQKIALNTLSTLMGVALGHVHRGQMVNLFADNAKLRHRAQQIVCRVTGASQDAASEALARAQGDVKVAALLTKGAASVDAARSALTNHNGHLAQAMSALPQPTQEHQKGD